VLATQKFCPRGRCRGSCARQAGRFGPLAVPESLDPPAIGRLREVQVPTRVIIGLEDLPAIQALSEYLASSIPRATLSRLPHTGHLPPLERPAEVSDAIRSLVSASA
jgi:pimeloyl-ACP methyl ester carboxylesterase